MKLAALCASLAVACAVPAAAQMHTDTHTRVVEKTTVVQHESRRGWNRHGWRKVCRTKWRHGERVRVCKRVRWH